MITKDSFIEKIIRNIKIFIPFKVRTFNKEFYNFLYLLKENETKSFKEMKNHQFSKLKEQVENVYKFSEFYKKKYDQFGFHPKDLKTLNDLSKIPILTKDEVRKNAKLMVLKNFRGKLYYGHTSGTTGKPLKLFFDKKTIMREWASICYQWERVGYKPTDGRVEFRGFIEKDVNFVFFPENKVLRINIIKMSEENINLILNKIKSKGYHFFHGYPSAIYKFAKILEKKKKNIHPKAILLASEVLYDWQMEIIDRVFPLSKKIIHYGQAEKIILGAWDNERKYSFIPSYGLLEINESNNEIIATGFINEIMPFIRYKLTDTIEGYNEKPLIPEKTLFPVIKTILGRLEDYTYNIKGEMIPPAIVTFPFKKLKHINACKIIQNSLDNFEILFEVEKNSLSIEEANQILNDLKKIYGHNVNMRYRFLKKIPEDKSGKFRWIECKIKN